MNFETVDFGPVATYAWRYFDAGTTLDIMRSPEEPESWEPCERDHGLQVVLAVRRFPEGTLRLYCEVTP